MLKNLAIFFITIIFEIESSLIPSGLSYRIFFINFSIVENPCFPSSIFAEAEATSPFRILSIIYPIYQLVSIIFSKSICISWATK